MPACVVCPQGGGHGLVTGGLLRHLIWLYTPGRVHPGIGQIHQQPGSSMSSRFSMGRIKTILASK